MMHPVVICLVFLSFFRPDLLSMSLPPSFSILSVLFPMRVPVALFGLRYFLRYDGSTGLPILSLILSLPLLETL